MTDESNAPDQTTPNLGAAPAMLEMTIHITRKATGLTETHKVYGTWTPPAEPPKEIS